MCVYRTIGPLVSFGTKRSDTVEDLIFCHKDRVPVCIFVGIRPCFKTVLQICTIL